MQFTSNIRIYSEERLNSFLIREFSFFILRPIWCHGRCFDNSLYHRCIETFFSKKLLKPKRSKYIAYIEYYIPYHLVLLHGFRT